MRITWFLWLMVLSTSHGLAEDSIPYRWQRDIQLPRIQAVTPITVPLDSRFFQATREAWPDVRLRNGQNQSVAFVIRTTQDVKSRQVRQTWTATQKSAKVDALGLQVEIESPEKNPLPQGINLLTPLRDFENQVRVESSADGQSWTDTGVTTLLFDYSKYIDARNVTILLPANTHRHFRLVITEITAEQESQLLELNRRLRGKEEVERQESTRVDRRPFRIDRLEFFRNDAQVETRQTQTVSYPATDFEVKQAEKTHQTHLTFTTQREPITEVMVITATDNFSRRVLVEHKILDDHGTSPWRHLATGTITRFAVGAIQKDEQTIALPETRSTRYRLVIENGDSPSLEITGIKLFGPRYELVFLATPNDALTFEYGSSKAVAGKYDTAALQAVLTQGQAVQEASFQEPQENPDAPAADKHDWLPWNDQRILFGSILLLTVLLGWGLYRAGKQITPLPTSESSSHSDA